MKAIPTLGTIAAACLIACAPALAADTAASPNADATSATAASKQLNRLADEYWDAQARFDPVSAGESGDNRYADQIGMSIAPKNRAHQFALY
jgi:hypothetical protein